MPIQAARASGQTTGVHIAPGDTRTIDVQLFSNAPSPKWSVVAQSVVDGALTMRFDRDSGANGEVLKLTITRAPGAAGIDPLTQGAPFLIYSFGEPGNWHLFVGYVN